MTRILFVLWQCLCGHVWRRQSAKAPERCPECDGRHGFKALCESRAGLPSHPEVRGFRIETRKGR